jgi:integrase
VHVDDRWTRPGEQGRRVRTERWGKGQRWRARWTDPDGRERERACATRDAAEALLAKVLVDMAAGAYVSPTAGQETFRSYAETWRAQQLHHRPSTAEQAESRLRLHVYPAIGSMPLGSVRRSHVQALVTRLHEQLAPSTIEVVYGYVATIFRSAVDDRLLAHSPCTRISLPEVVTSRVVPLLLEQVTAIREALPARYQAMAALDAASGLRSGELRGLTVDRLSPRLHVQGARVPSEVALRVDRQMSGVSVGRPVVGPPKSPAGPSAVAALRTHLEQFGPGPDGLLFTTMVGRPVSRSTAGDLWRDATDGMLLRPRSGWHDLRHFHASLLIADGLSVRAVADRLGHEDPAETLRTYAHLWIDDEDRAVAASERALRML